MFLSRSIDAEFKLEFDGIFPAVGSLEGGTTVTGTGWGFLVDSPEDCEVCHNYMLNVYSHLKQMV